MSKSNKISLYSEMALSLYRGNLHQLKVVFRVATTAKSINFLEHDFAYMLSMLDF
jgi:hypothetical protein